MFVWLDTETTGLDPLRDEVLAVGIIVTDDSFREVARNEWTISHREIEGLMSRHVYEMHTASGLLGRVRAADPTLSSLDAVEGDVSRWLRSVLGVPDPDIKRRPPLAGNTIGFDRAMLAKHMPQVLSHVHYRSLDVSSLKVLAMATVPGAREWNDSRPDPAHTPLADLEGSIQELAHWRQVLAGADL